MKYLGSRKPSAFPGVRITPLAEQKKGIPSVRARGPSMNTATSQFGRMPLMTPGSPGNPEAKWMCVLPWRDKPFSRIDGQCFQNVPWTSVKGRACGVSRGVSSNSGTSSHGKSQLQGPVAKGIGQSLRQLHISVLFPGSMSPSTFLPPSSRGVHDQDL